MAVYRMSAEAEFERTADALWNLVADYGHDANWRTGVIRMTSTPTGPVRLGTTTDELLRLAGRSYRNLGEVTAVEPNRHFRWRTVHGADAEGARTVTAISPARCRVRLELAVRVTGAQRLIAPVLAAMLRRNLAKDLERLRLLVHSANADGAGSR